MSKVAAIIVGDDRVHRTHWRLCQHTGLDRFLGGRSQRLNAGMNLGFFHSEDGSVLPNEILIEKSARQAFNVVFFDRTQVLLRQAEFIGDL